MYDFIRSRIKSNIAKELEMPVLWNTVLKECKANFETDKALILVPNNLPGEFDKEIIHGLARCMDFGFSVDIIWIRTFEDFFRLLENALNEKKTYVSFCSEESLTELCKKKFSSEFCHVSRMEFDQEDLEELLEHFGQIGTSLREERFTVGELFLALFLLSIVKSDFELVTHLIKNLQYAFVDDRLLLVPKSDILQKHVIELKNETITSVLGIDSRLLQCFAFYETLQASCQLEKLPSFPRITLANLLVSKIIVDKLGPSTAFNRLKDLAKFYDLEYFEELERIARSTEFPISGHSYAKSNIAAGLSCIIQEKLKLTCFAFHGLEYEFAPKQGLQKDFVSEDFYKTVKLGILDPIFVKFSGFKFDDSVLNTVLETQIKQIKDTNLKLDEKFFGEKDSRKSNDTKLISLICNLLYFDLLGWIHSQVVVSPSTKERFISFLSKVEAQFFSLDENMLRDLEKSMGITNFLDLSEISFLDEFPKNIVFNLAQIIEGTTFANDLINLKPDQLLAKFLDLYQENLSEFRESAQPKNIRKWSLISFFYDYSTDYLIKTYSRKPERNITHIIDEIIDHTQKEDFAHVILLVIDGLSYIHWQLIKPDLLKKLKNIASLRLDEFRLGPVLSRTPVGHSALFSGLPFFENGIYSDILKFDDTYVNLMQSKWARDNDGKILPDPSYLKNIAFVKDKISKNVFKGKHRERVKFYFFTMDTNSPMTMLFENFLKTKGATPQAKLTKKVEKEEQLRFSEENIKKIAHFVYQLKDKELKGYISVVQYPDIDQVMHSSGWNFQYYLDQVQRQIEYLVTTIRKELGGKILLAITSDHGSISLAETRTLTDVLPFKFSMKDFEDLIKQVPSFNKEINRFSYSYLQLFEESQVAAIKSFLGDESKALEILADERLLDIMGKPTTKELKYPKAFVIPKYIMHFSEQSILRHGGCSLCELLIPFVLIEVGG
jgi:hypothetical protein